MTSRRFGSLRRYGHLLDLREWRLQGLTSGEPVTLYHGTTGLFRKFDVARARKELVDEYYGGGIFLTPSKRIAADYAQANRNIGFPPSLIDDLKRRNPKAAKLLHALYARGDSAWDDLAAHPEYRGQWEKLTGGADPNTLGDLAAFIIGSKVKPVGNDRPETNIFNIRTGMPDWIYDSLDQIGLDSKTYRPKVYTVSVTARHPLITGDKEEARSARGRGYDAVVYYGPGAVQDIPEVAVFDPARVKIKSIEVV